MRRQRCIEGYHSRQERGEEPARVFGERAGVQACGAGG